MMEPPVSIPVSKIPAAIAEITGRAPSIASVKRWIRDGSRGVKLQVGGPMHFRFTRPEWIEEFLLKCGNAKTENEAQTEKLVAHSESIERAREILATEFGFKHRRKA
ncbi:MAG: hypothetical protein JSS49_05295 [Planctomycetes bacterium]|nr:hypothetical protein [Planctomycetota bacterium]